MAPWVGPPVGPACVEHECGGPRVVRAYQFAAPTPLELVAFLCWHIFAPLELVDVPLEVGIIPLVLFARLVGRQIFRCGVYRPVVESALQRLNITDLVT